MRRPVRLLMRAAAATILALSAVAVLPVTIVAVIGVGVASRRGWQPGRLYRAAAWCLPMLAVWLAATAIASARSGLSARRRTWHGSPSGSRRRGTTSPPPCSSRRRHRARPARSRLGLVAWRIRSMAAQAGGRRLQPRSLRSTAMAAPGAQRAGQDCRARRRPAADRARRLRRRRGDPHGRPPGSAAHAAARRAGSAPIRSCVGAPEPARRRCCFACGRLHGDGLRPACGRAGRARRCSWCSTARAALTPGASLTAAAAYCEMPEPGTWPSGPMKPTCRCGPCPPGS